MIQSIAKVVRHLYKYNIIAFNFHGLHVEIKLIFTAIYRNMYLLVCNITILNT